MTDYSGFSSYMDKYIQQNVELTAYKSSELWKWFVNMGLTKPMPRGVNTHITTILEQAEPGKIVSALSDIPEQTAKLSETTTTVCTLGTKLALPLNLVDKWVENPIINISPTQVIDNVIRTMVLQVDSYAAWGDKGVSMLTGARDSTSNTGTFNGLFGSGTAFAAGIGGDNNTSAAGDWFATHSTAIKALKNAGYTADQYTMIANVDTVESMRNGNHIYTTYPTTELKMLQEEKDFGELISSPNIDQQDGGDYALYTYPYKKGPMGEAHGAAYRLLVGYNFEVLPLYNGGLGPNAAYEWIVIWSGALDVLDKTAIQVSGSLTLA